MVHNDSALQQPCWQKALKRLYDTGVFVGNNAYLTASSPASAAAQTFMYASVTRNTLNTYYLAGSKEMACGFFKSISDLKDQTIPQLTAIASLACLCTKEMTSMTRAGGYEDTQYCRLALANSTFECLFGCLRKAIQVRQSTSFNL